MSKISLYIKLMRPYQWVKNLFCFCGVVFGFHFFEYGLLLKSLLCFLAFCCAASAVYVLNDLLDAESDRKHPKKQNRPIASGMVSISDAKILYALLLVLAVFISLSVNLVVMLIVVTYMLSNVLYSLKTKHIVLLDVFFISFGFLLRIFAGTYGIGIPQSEWLLLCAITLTLFLGFAKRRSEILQFEGDNSNSVTRLVLQQYEPRMLDILLAVTSATTIMSYALFIVIGKQNHNLIYTIPFVIYGIFRYIYLLYQKSGGQDTANDLLDDTHLIVTVLLWVLSYLLFSYL